jgi:hypothetical protein
MGLSALALILALAGAGGAVKPGEAKGKLTVNGETAEITNAYLTPEPGTAGVVTLSSAPVGPELRNQALMFEKREPVKQGKLYLMNVKLDPQGKVVISFDATR